MKNWLYAIGIFSAIIAIVFSIAHLLITYDIARKITIYLISIFATIVIIFIIKKNLDKT